MGYETARAERDFRQNPPSTAPGQGGSVDDWDSMEEGSSSVDSSSNIAESYNTDINSTLNNTGTSNQPGVVQQNNGQPNPQQYTATEDKVLHAAGVGIKSFWSYLKFLVSSLKNSSKADKHIYGVQICKISAITLAVGGISCIWEMFSQNGNRPIELLIGSVLSMMVGITLCMLYDLDDSGNEDLEEPESSLENTESEPSEEEEDWGDINYENDEGEEELLNEDDWNSSEEDDWGNVLDGVDLNDTSSIESENFSVEDAVNELSNISPGTQTRQYLFEAYLKVLPLVNPGYSKLEPISEASDEFYMFEDYLRAAAGQVGMKEENYPELNTVQENPFIYRITCTRPVGMKEQLIADEIANTYSRDDNNIQFRFGVYATVETSTGRCSINLFKGFEKDYKGEQKGGVFISLGDVYRQIRDFVCDSEIEMPLVWGIGALGDSKYCDAKDINSIIICGEPRGGKSWKGQSILAQLAMFHSPKELQFYILDNKNNASDYKYLSTVMPHVRYFCGDPDKFNDSLEQIINMMLETNGKKLADAGEINIKDYNKSHPTDKLPYVYIVIDELQALMNHYDKTDQKEEAKKFRGYLSTLVSKYPYIGLRLIMFPHRIVDRIISKDTYALVSSRAVVNQLDAKLIESSVGVSESKFRYKLAQKGDMAIRMHEIDNGEAAFCHAEILTHSNGDNKKLFNYIGQIWGKLEPDMKPIEMRGTVGGYIGVKAEEKLARRSEPARDNTAGKASYSYSGFDTGSGVSDLEDEGFDFNLDDDDTDESFWDDVMKD